MNHISDCVDGTGEAAQYFCVPALRLEGEGEGGGGAMLVLARPLGEPPPRMQQHHHSGARLIHVVIGLA